MLKRVILRKILNVVLNDSSRNLLTTNFLNNYNLASIEDINKIKKDFRTSFFQKLKEKLFLVENIILKVHRYFKDDYFYKKILS